jgi:hypothetical protein
MQGVVLGYVEMLLDTQTAIKKKQDSSNTSVKNICCGYKSFVSYRVL